MWNKGFRLIWLHIKTQKQKNISFSIPISLAVLTELLECFSDLFAVTGIILPKTAYHSISVPAGKMLLASGIKLLESMSIGEPYNLADISVNKVKIVIEVK